MQLRAPFLLAAAVCALGFGPSDSQAQATRCRTSECFDSHDVRDFEVIGDDTLVAYVGRDRCPFLIKVDSLYCDLRFLPDIQFVKTRRRSDAFLSTRVCTHDTGIGLNPLGMASRDANPRVSNERVILDPRTGDPANGARFGSELTCRIMDFRAISDDEIIELYVDAGYVAPPPPIGTGQISRAPEEGDEADAEQAGEAADTEAAADVDR